MSKTARYKLIQDNDCHWYLITVEQEKLFNELLSDWEKFEDADFKRVDGPHAVSFVDPKESDDAD